MKKSKVILVALCAVLLVAASVMGTLAYLTSTDQVVNTFTVGKVQITLDEAEVNQNGQLIAGTTLANALRTDSNDYHLMPGLEYIKDPTVHVADDSEPCYLFVKVENGISGIEAEQSISYQPIYQQMINNGWRSVYDFTTTDGYCIYVFGDDSGKPVVVNGGDNRPVFSEFAIGSGVTGEQLAQYEDAKIKVTAYAVQADGFSGMGKDIWNQAGFQPALPQ